MFSISAAWDALHEELAVALPGLSPPQILDEVNRLVRTAGSQSRGYVVSLWG